MTARMTVFGEHIADLVTQPDGDLRPFPGGSPVNVAVALARLGTPVSLGARLADDVFGRTMRAHLERQGVSTEHVVAAAEPSTLAVVSLDAAGVASYDFWIDGTADWQWSDADLADHPATGVNALHTGSLASWTPPGDAALLRLWQRSGDSVTLSYDPNARPRLMGGSATARAMIDGFVKASHLIKVSDEDLEVLEPGRDPLEVAAEWQRGGPQLVVVTRGSAGVVAIRDDEVVEEAAPRVTVADTVAAGDTFSAGFLHALDEGGFLAGPPGTRLLSPAIGGDLDSESLRACLRYAAHAAALACTKPGPQPPTAAEVEASIAG